MATRQTALRFKRDKNGQRRGGPREGAGRKPSGRRTMLAHRERDLQAGRYPVHVTLRAMPDLPNLRQPALAAAIGQALRAAAQREPAEVRARVVQFSIQADHVHLLVEAASAADLAHGLRGLGVRLAHAVNRELGRRGAFSRDRYHARELRTPREVRNALVYVLGNWRKHGRSDGAIDPCSSGRWFEGWARPVEAPVTVAPVHPARTWLARTGWRRHGPLRFDERPAAD